MRDQTENKSCSHTCVDLRMARGPSPARAVGFDTHIWLPIQCPCRALAGWSSPPRLIESAKRCATELTGVFRRCPMRSNMRVHADAMRGVAEDNQLKMEQMQVGPSHTHMNTHEHARDELRSDA
eukprot:4329942-Pyramimonas_sp.AAC.1